MSGEATVVVSCPGCGKQYRVRETATRMRCKGCGAAFGVGTSQRDREREARQGKREQNTAIKLLVGTAVALTLVGLLIYGLSQSSSPVSVGEVETSDPRHRDLPKPTRSIFDNRDIPATDEPRKIAIRFLEAMGQEKADEIEELFLFDLYYDWVAHRYHWPDDDPRRYEIGGPEAQKEKRDEAIDVILLPERSQYIKQYLLPAIQEGTDEEVHHPVKPDVQNFEWRLRDGSGKLIMNLSLSVRLKTGMDPKEDNQKPEAWGVWKIQDLWHVSTLEIDKPEDHAVDILEGRRRKKEIAARKARAKGPAEEEPAQQEPLEGTGPTQMSNIRQWLAVILQLDSAGRDLIDAENGLIRMGKPAIPYLLNELVGRNHETDDQDIRKAFEAIKMLREITGEHFGYGPTAGEGMAIGGMTTATAEERARAVRRWFGWWRWNKKSFAGRKELPEEEEEDLDEEDR